MLKIDSNWPAVAGVQRAECRLADESAAALEAQRPARADDDGGETRAYLADERPATVEQLTRIAQAQGLNCFCCGKGLRAFEPGDPLAVAIGRVFPELPHIYANAVVVHSACRGAELAAARSTHGWRAVHRLRLALRTPMLRRALADTVSLAMDHWPVAQEKRGRRSQIDVANRVLADSAPLF